MAPQILTTAKTLPIDLHATPELPYWKSPFYNAGGKEPDRQTHPAYFYHWETRLPKELYRSMLLVAEANLPPIMEANICEELINKTNGNYMEKLLAAAWPSYLPTAETLRLWRTNLYSLLGIKEKSTLTAFEGVQLIAFTQNFFTNKPQENTPEKIFQEDLKGIAPNLVKIEGDLNNQLLKYLKEVKSPLHELLQTSKPSSNNDSPLLKNLRARIMIGNVSPLRSLPQSIIKLHDLAPEIIAEHAELTEEYNVEWATELTDWNPEKKGEIHKALDKILTRGGY